MCSAVHTASCGRSPVARHNATRASVHTTARGRRPFGNSTQCAGFCVNNPRRIAAFNAAVNAPRIRCSVVGANGRPRAELTRTRAVNMACSMPIVNSRNTMLPKAGLR
ncbi:MAG TPA: hypothetical protein VFV67_17750 [Actinophytocola sp.]|uniref:hypothetical protein n=1 Tax=Actinophytocola sp. TaxID=1872138 RepID=UPI002DBAA0FD|nr:hypothetical protein [Actinophytocola sp.]HEU5472498.1 hypothetical protein [Actinophytocola sp.]